MRNDSIVRTCVGIVTAAMAASCVWAAHYYVAPGGTGDYSQASPGGDPNYCSRNVAKTSGDVIHLAAGTYTLGITPTGNQQIFLQPGVTLIGATDNPADTVIDGAGKYRAACCFQTASIRNLTMRNCKTTSAEGGGFGFGGAVCAQSDNGWNYSVSNCVVDGASATYKGGGGSHGIWRDCVIRNCKVTYPGYDTTPGSSIEGSGGGVWGGELHNCVVTNNYAAFAGGGIAGGSFHANDACRAYDNCLIGWNEAGIGGGSGVRGGSALSVCQLFDCTIISNTVHALAGFGVERGGGADGCTLTNCTVTGNSAHLYGGGLHRSLAIGCIVSGNTTTNVYTIDYGGGGASQSVLTNCVVTGNVSYYTGAGLFRSTAVGTIVTSNRLNASTVSGNETTGGAGAAESTLLRCTVEGNDAGIVWFGGGLRACEATDCVIRFNLGPYGGGGYNGLFVRCTVSNNVATTRSGGGIYNATSYNCVVAFNISTNYDPSGSNSWGRGAVCRGYHQGALIYSNFFNTGAAVTALKGATDIAIVNCTVFGNRARDNNHNGFNNGYATNCIVYGHPNTDVYTPKALVNSLWGVDMVSHGKLNEDPSLTNAAIIVNCKARVNPQFTMQTRTNACPFSLKGSSPARNAGLLLDWMAVMDKDILGNDRVRENVPDMGACEYHGPIGLKVKIW